MASGMSMSVCSLLLTSVARKLTVSSSSIRSRCPLMPGTLPGCHLMAGRDKRSNMETGKVHHQFPFHHTDLFFPHLGLIFFVRFLSQQHQDYHILLPSALDLLPWPGVRLVRKPGSVFALERTQEAGAAGGRLRLVRHRKLNQWVRFFGLYVNTSEWQREGSELLNTRLWKWNRLQPD